MTREEETIEKEGRKLIAWKIWVERFSAVRNQGCGCMGCAVAIILFFAIGSVGTQSASSSSEPPSFLLVILGIALLLLILGTVGWGITMVVYSNQKRIALRSQSWKDALVDLLTKNVQEQQYAKYGANISVLGDLGNKRATLPITVVLESEDEEIRRKSIEALMKLGDDRAMTPVAAALHDKVKKIRQQAGIAVDKLGWKPTDDRENAHYLIARERWDELARLGEPAVDPLIKALEYDTKDVRKQAAKILGKLGHKKAIEPLTDALRDQDKDVRETAKEALNKIRED